MRLFINVYCQMLFLLFRCGGVMKNKCIMVVTAIWRKLLLSEFFFITKIFHVVYKMKKTKFIALETSLSSHSRATTSHDEFDEEYYLKKYPDIATSGIDAYYHYIYHGKAEGRQGTPYQFKLGSMAFCNEKATVLLVSHEASRTGAPILALNICQELNKQYNVIVILLNGGSIFTFFESTCTLLVDLSSHGLMDPFYFTSILDRIQQQYVIKFCIVNSIESHPILRPLAEKFISSILLVHEFFAYTRPRIKFIESLSWAGVTVFSSKIVQDNAAILQIDDFIKTTHILSQGKSTIPIQTTNLIDDIERPFDISSMVVSTKHESKPFIVLGAGMVQYRKGVDLFIATASEIKRLYPEYNIKMLWVGKGFDPENDIHYSCYLAEQVDRSGLKSCFQFIDEISNLEDLYEITDLFFLSSRLDPLPNVAIDAMTLGIPLICFENGSGIAEFLKLDVDTTTCIIPYTSTAGSTQKIIDFYRSSEYYSLISKKTKILAHKHFNMEKYVAQLVDLSLKHCDVAEQERIDCGTLENSSDFIESFYQQLHADRSDAIRRYVRSWHSKINLFRKPAPGFNGMIYSQHHDCSARHVEPFAEYIRLGKPKGPWQDDVISPSSLTEDAGEQLRCAIHIHAYYPDLLQGILDRLQLNVSNYDLFVSTTEIHATSVLDILFKNKKHQYKIAVVPNRGRDLGPFLTEFRYELQQYEVIGHFHTKKSLNLNDFNFTHAWNHLLFENLLGGENCMLDKIITKFKQEKELGLVFADDPYLLGWDKNKVYAERIALQLGLSKLPEHKFNFPVGTMFWVRPNALKPLFDLAWTWDMYPDEPLPLDGSLLHAIERLIPMVVEHQGYSRAVTHIFGVTRPCSFA